MSLGPGVVLICVCGGGGGAGQEAPGTRTKLGYLLHGLSNAHGWLASTRAAVNAHAPPVVAPPHVSPAAPAHPERGGEDGAVVCNGGGDARRQPARSSSREDQTQPVCERVVRSRLAVAITAQDTGR